MTLDKNQKKLKNLITDFDEENLEKIKKLIRTTDLNFIVDDDKNRTILHKAVMLEKLALVQIILAASDINAILDSETKKGNTAVDLAIQRENLAIFQALHQAGAKYDRKAAIETLQQKAAQYDDEDDDNNAANNVRAIVNFIKDNTPKRIHNDQGKELGVYGYPGALKKSAQQKEFKRQQGVTEKFFRVGKSLQQGKDSTKLYGEILTAIDMNWSVTLDGYSARAVVIALSKLLQKFKKFPSVVFKLGETELTCEPADDAGRKRQAGNLLVKIKNLAKAPRYGKEIDGYILSVLEANNSRHKKLARLFQKYSKTMTSFTLEDFNSNGKIKLAGENPYQPNGTATDQKLAKVIHVLNFLNFMYAVAEIVRRLYREKDGSLFNYQYSEPAATSDRFPVASFHARAIDLMRSGAVKFKGVYGNSGTKFDNRPKYGVVSGKNTIWNMNKEFSEGTNVPSVEEKAFSVNELMAGCHEANDVPHYAARHPEDYLLTRSFWLHAELRDQFGGDSESSGSEYDSDSDTQYLSEQEADVADQLAVKGLNMS